MGFRAELVSLIPVLLSFYLGAAHMGERGPAWNDALLFGGKSGLRHVQREERHAESTIGLYRHGGQPYLALGLRSLSTEGVANNSRRSSQTQLTVRFVVYTLSTAKHHL